MKTLEVRKPTDEIVSVMNEYQPSMIGCYPTAMEVLANVRHVISISMMIGLFLKRLMKTINLFRSEHNRLRYC